MLQGLVVALLALGVAACALHDWRRNYHRGPVTGHFDGQTFRLPGHRSGKGLWAVVKWRVLGSRGAWPDAVPLVATARPDQRVHGESLVVTFVGHATVLLQTAGLNILTDPTWAQRASLVTWAGPKRVTPPGIRFEDLPPIDVVLVSHSHFDHMDLPTLTRLQAAHDPLFVMPLGNDAIVRDAAPDARTRTLDWWQSTDVATGIRVHVVPVYHWSRRTLFDRNKALWGGFAIETPGGPLYFAGDTGFADGRFFREARERLGAPRLAMIPVGAYEPRWFMRDQHVNPAEAVQIHELLGARHSLGIHFRTFQLTDEPWGKPEADLAEARRARSIDAARFFTLDAGAQWQASATAGEPPAR